MILHPNLSALETELLCRMQLDTINKVLSA